MIRMFAGLVSLTVLSGCGAGADQTTFGFGKTGLGFTMPTGAITNAPVPRREGDLMRWKI
jgi:hypothetical protein